MAKEIKYELTWYKISTPFESIALQILLFEEGYGWTIQGQKVSNIDYHLIATTPETKRIITDERFKGLPR